MIPSHDAYVCHVMTDGHRIANVVVGPFSDSSEAHRWAGAQGIASYTVETMRR